MTRVWLIVFALSAACGEPTERSAQMPDTEAELYDWLADGEYKETWISEATVTIGENNAPRRLFVNRDLHEGFDDEVFKQGAAAVREMYEADQHTLRGISAMQKRENGWFFYEIFELQKPATPSVADIEPVACVRCHSAGHDLVQSDATFFDPNPLFD